MAMLRLYYLCPAHGHFHIRREVEDLWPKDVQCPHCGALSKRDYQLTSVVEER